MAFVCFAIAGLLLIASLKAPTSPGTGVAATGVAATQFLASQTL